MAFRDGGVSLGLGAGERTHPAARSRRVGAAIGFVGAVFLVLDNALALDAIKGLAADESGNNGLAYHFAVYAAAGRVVDDDVAFGPYAGVDVVVDTGVAGCAVVGVARMHRYDAGAGVVAVVGVLRDFGGLGGQVGVLAFKRHAAGRGDGDDDFWF